MRGREREKERERGRTVVRVGEDGTVSVDVIAGLDLAPLHPVAQQPHSVGGAETDLARLRATSASSKAAGQFTLSPLLHVRR